MQSSLISCQSQLEGTGHRQRLLSLLLLAVRPTGLFFLILIGGLYFATPPFDHKLLFSAVLFLIAGEKMWAMCFRKKDRFHTHVQNDWTTVTVAWSYVTVMYAVVIEYYVRRPEQAWTVGTGLGVALYLAALGWRYWTLHVLGNQWTVHLDRMEHDWQLITSGPYRLVRHPLYLAFCVEAVAVPLIFGSYWAMLLALLVYIPLQAQRAYFEEKYLRKAFGDHYAAYARRTWALFPLPFGKRRL